MNKTRTFLFSIFYFLVSVLIILLSTFYFLASVTAASSAPSFYLDQTNQAVAGSVFSVKVLLGMDQPVNAYSVQLRYSTDFLELAGFNDSHSIIDVWQSKSSPAAGAIKLSGGSLKPFTGQRGELITINFKALKEGAAGIAFGNSAIYLANGEGTEILPESGVLHIAIGGQSAIPISEPVDASPPQIKFLSLEPDPFSQKQKFLTFLAADADSGVQTTELRTWSYLWWGAWTPVQNPAALSASAWAVEFRAIDNSGNAIVKIIYDWGAFPRFIIIIIGMALSAVFVAWFILRKAAL